MQGMGVSCIGYKKNGIVVDCLEYADDNFVLSELLGEAENQISQFQEQASKNKQNNKNN